MRESLEDKVNKILDVDSQINKSVRASLILESMRAYHIEHYDGSTTIAVRHGNVDPRDSEWELFLNFSMKVIDEKATSKVVIVSGGGGPSKKQTDRLMSTVYEKWKTLYIIPKISVISEFGDNVLVNATLRAKVLLISFVLWLKGYTFIKYFTNVFEAREFVGITRKNWMDVASVVGIK